MKIDKFYVSPKDDDKSGFDFAINNVLDDTVHGIAILGSSIVDNVVIKRCDEYQYGIEVNSNDLIDQFSWWDSLDGFQLWNMRQSNPSRKFSCEINVILYKLERVRLGFFDIPSEVWQTNLDKISFELDGQNIDVNYAIWKETPKNLLYTFNVDSKVDLSKKYINLVATVFDKKTLDSGKLRGKYQIERNLSDPRYPTLAYNDRAIMPNMAAKDLAAGSKLNFGLYIYHPVYETKLSAVSK